jgi:hypothetical protein
VGSPDQREDRRSRTEREKRLYSLGGLARSYAPRGLAEVHRRSRASQRAQLADARAQLRTAPRLTRLSIALTVAYLAMCVVLVLVAAVTRDALLFVVAMVGLFAAVLLHTIVLAAVRLWSDRRRSSGERDLDPAAADRPRED